MKPVSLQNRVRFSEKGGLGPNSESIATLPPFCPIEGYKRYLQISNQWESQKNLFAFISSGKIQFLPPCLWDLPFMSYRLCEGLHHAMWAVKSIFIGLQISLYIEVNHLDSHISFEKNRVVGTQTEIKSFWIWTQITNFDAFFRPVSLLPLGFSSNHLPRVWSSSPCYNSWQETEALTKVFLYMYYFSMLRDNWNNSPCFRIGQWVLQHDSCPAPCSRERPLHLPGRRLIRLHPRLLHRLRAHPLLHCRQSGQEIPCQV